MDRLEVRRPLGVWRLSITRGGVIAASVALVSMIILAGILTRSVGYIYGSTTVPYVAGFSRQCDGPVRIWASQYDARHEKLDIRDQVMAKCARKARSRLLPAGIGVFVAGAATGVAATLLLLARRPRQVLPGLSPTRADRAGHTT